MGYYINKNSKTNYLPAKGKADALIADGAKEIFGEDIKYQPNLVCVVQNISFDGAGYAFSENEFKAFNDSKDGRKKRWLIYEHAKELAE